ncbi:MAG: hypothetical protein AB7G76_14655 [Steroidobacteraceae bacterium]
MKAATLCAASMLAAVFATGQAMAQERYTEGPVWQCDSYEVMPDMWNDYLDWLRGNAKSQYDEAKKQGLIMDWKVFIPSQRMQDGTDIVICSLFANYGKALDYSKADADKWDAIASARLQTADQKKQMEMMAPRLKMRRYTGTIYLREAMLKPLP